MRLGTLWDYFMRRKLLLLALMAALIALGLGYRFCFEQKDEILEMESPKTNEIAEVEIPKTGEIVTKNEEVGCDAELANQGDVAFGNGENGAEATLEPDDEVTFWGAEAPAVFVGPEQLAAEVGEKNESVIVATGLLAAIVVLGAGKFVFDRYVR